MQEQVILVDEKDNQIGVEEKLDAHKAGKLHRAFSIFVFNSKNELLLQRRALDKYHSAGLWTNTCCSHPRPGESIGQAASRRLKEEMGFECPLVEAHSFVYKAPYDNGLTEHEFDYVLTGKFDGEPLINPKEVDSYKWIALDTLKKDISESPEDYTVWFKICLDQVLEIERV